MADLNWLHVVDQVGKLFVVGKVPIVEEQPCSGVVEILIDVVDSIGAEGACPLDQPVDLVALGQQKLSQGGSRLAP